MLCCNKPNQKYGSHINTCVICLEDDNSKQVSELNYVFECKCIYAVHAKCFRDWICREPRCIMCGEPVIPRHIYNTRLILQYMSGRIGFVGCVIVIGMCVYGITLFIAIGNK